MQILTKEVHIAKGGRVTDEDISLQVSSTSQHTSSSDVISSQLVTFKWVIFLPKTGCLLLSILFFLLVNDHQYHVSIDSPNDICLVVYDSRKSWCWSVYRDIQELQKQNQQLRSALRELSEEQETVEKEGQASILATSLQRDLENTKQEVQHLKQFRLKQEELVQSIIKQKDMYKRLVEQGDVREVCIGSYSLCVVFYLLSKAFTFFWWELIHFYEKLGCFGHSWLQSVGLSFSLFIYWFNWTLITCVFRLKLRPYLNAPSLKWIMRSWSRSMMSSHPPKTHWIEWLKSYRTIERSREILKGKCHII